jgi:fibrillarin-like rRNA methylase
MQCEVAHVCNDDCTVYIVETSLFIVRNLVRERVVIMYRLLNDADSHSDYSYIVANDRMICEKWIGKSVKGCNRELI